MQGGIDVNRIQRSQPAYMQIARAEAAKIEAGVYPQGMPFPSIPKLAEMWGVSRMTAHNARKVLQRAGYLSAQQGSGTWPLLRGPYRELRYL